MTYDFDSLPVEPPVVVDSDDLAWALDRLHAEYKNGLRYKRMQAALIALRSQGSNLEPSA